MAEKLKLTRAVLVEGRYDKIMLENLLDATILTTEGFGIFKNTEKKALLRRIAGTRGLIVLVDSDGGGRQIRSYLTGLLPKSGVTHLYIPPVAGKESRKAHRSRAGLLGVEGTDADTLRALFAPYAVPAAGAKAGADGEDPGIDGEDPGAGSGNDTGRYAASGVGTAAGTDEGTRTYTKADLYERGLLGGEGSADRRRALEARLGLPEMSSNALLDALNLLGIDLDAPAENAAGEPGKSPSPVQNA